ncbi:ATP-binding protein [Arabiibacter massiliensis]|uniref:ATP-binding protein n=1 Tax=Arabiibacter massiliensis TaxID=1870985 RepID=UPI00155A3F5F|nr:ATP-binding protein [Arabiibacter massiliensis]
MKARRSHMQLWARFAVLVGLAGVVVFGVYLAWSTHAESAENERRALAEARVLSAQMDSSWDYVDSIQDRINYTDGTFDFKGVYCSVAGKSIAKRFTDRTDYVIRYVREDPRSGTDEPDEFEQAALDAFAHESVTEHYGMQEYEGAQAFRYVSALRAERNCLECHGEPAGEKDATGFLKEGMRLDDLAGAVSIVLPMDAIVAESNADLAGTVTFFCVLMAAVTAVLFWGLRRWVTAPIISENDMLRRDAESQSNFLSIITHELKTPLSSILAFTELWKRGGHADRDVDRELVEEIETNSHVLLSMINNLLDTAKMDEGSLALAEEDLDVYDVVGLVKSTAGPLAKRRGVSLAASIAPGTPIVRTDREMLRRVILNLVSNALRFTGEGGSVSLRLSYGEGVLTVEVQDTGAGIPEDRLATVFDRFVSAPGSEVSGEGGTGLGLSIVKRYAEMTGGWVKAESEQGRGSTFTVVLPMPARSEEDEGI